MKIFIFNGVAQLTKNYHPEGSLVVIAKSKKAAKKLIKQENEREDNAWNEAQIELTDEEWGDVISYKLEDVLPPSRPRVFIFPNAGCC